MNEASPLFSCLCVTEKRSAFMPWLLWNFDRQSWANKELIIVDSSPEPARFARDDVRVISVSPGASVPEKRNRALAEARGPWVAWFDDDDWQHPDRLRRLAGALVEGAQVVGMPRSALLDLRTGGVQAYDDEHADLVFNGVGLTTNAARSRDFELSPVVGSELRWLRALCATFAGEVRLLSDPLLTVLLSHHSNLCNPPHKWRLTNPLDELVTRLGEDAWAETDAELDTLRARVDEQLASLPAPSSQPDPDALKRKPYQMFGYR